MPTDVPRLARLDRARQARFQALYGLVAAFSAAWRAWGWAKLLIALGLSLGR